MEATNEEAPGGDPDELPENFFEDFENNDFLDELVENVEFNEDEDPDERMVVESDEDKPSNRRSRSSSPIVNRCLEEIDKLTQEIRRRKRRLQQELSANDGASRTISEIETPTSTTEVEKHGRKSRRSPRRSRSPRRRSRESHHTSSSRTTRTETSSRRPPKVPNTRVRRRSRSRSPPRRLRSREPRSRRPRSGSPPRKIHRRAAASPPTTQMSFLDELEQTFAKQGKAFPEKDLLLRTKSQSIIVDQQPNDYQSPDSVNQFFTNDPPLPFPHSGFPYGRQVGNALLPTPLYPEEVPHPAMYRRDLMARPVVVDIPQPVPLPVPPPNPPFNIQRCKQAIRILNALENRVPKSSFVFTPTSTKADKTVKPTTTDSPLSNAKNVSFQLTTPAAVVARPMEYSVLPTRSTAVLRALGFGCNQLVEALRMKTLVTKVIETSQPKQSYSTKTTTITKNVYVQTMEIECEVCAERKNIVCLNQSVQTESPKSVSIKVQTNTENYSEPVFNTLKSMTSAQLVAMTDFAHIVCDPRPSNSEEMFKLREQLMDVYNLSQRDDEAVRLAERQRLNSVRSLLSTHRRVTDGSTVSVDVVPSAPQPTGSGSSTEAMIRDAEIELRLAEAREIHSRPSSANAMSMNQPNPNFQPNNHPNQNQMNTGPPVFSRGGGFPWRSRGGRGGPRGGGPRGGGGGGGGQRGNRWF